MFYADFLGKSLKQDKGSRRPAPLQVTKTDPDPSLPPSRASGRRPSLAHAPSLIDDEDDEADEEQSASEPEEEPREEGEEPEPVIPEAPSAESEAEPEVAEESMDGAGEETVDASWAGFSFEEVEDDGEDREEDEALVIALGRPR